MFKPLYNMVCYIAAKPAFSVEQQSRHRAESSATSLRRMYSALGGVAHNFKTVYAGSKSLNLKYCSKFFENRPPETVTRQKTVVPRTLFHLWSQRSCLCPHSNWSSYSAAIWESFSFRGWNAWVQLGEWWRKVRYTYTRRAPWSAMNERPRRHHRTKRCARADAPHLWLV